jgi:signal transduction histidine kinase
MTLPPFLKLFRTRLILMICLIALPALALVLNSYWEQRKTEKARVGAEAMAVSRIAAANQENYLKNSKQLLATLTQLSFLVNSSDRAFCQTSFSNLMKLSPDYEGFGLIEADGTLFCSANNTNKPVHLGDRHYFRGAVETKKFTVGDFQFGRLTHRPSLNLGYPVLDDHGEVRRVIFAALRLPLMSEALTNIGVPAGGNVMVLDRNGTVLARQPDPDQWIGKSLANEPQVQKILQSKAELVTELKGKDGIARLHALKPAGDGSAPGLYVSVSIPLAISFAHANEILIRNLIIMALVGLLVVAAIWVFASRSFLRPVRALSGAAKRLADGDLSARIGSCKGASELVELGHAFDVMAERLEERRIEINELNQDLERRVTERTAQLAEANAELEAFCYSVSHDLRAPLRHIGGYAEMLESHLGTTLDTEGTRLLKTVESSAKRMGVLIDDLLELSRMGRAAMKKAEVDLDALLREAIEMQTHSNGRRIEWKTNPLGRINGDHALLRQVFLNLISNALKYSRTRDPAIIEVGRQPAVAEELIVFVRDNGVGFNPAYMAKLFGVFQRLHDSQEFEGTGIGLANVRRIISRHGGRTWAESELDHGATFYFSLPRQPITSL